MLHAKAFAKAFSERHFNLSGEAYGYLALITAAAMWGTGGPVIKMMFNQDLHPFLFVKIRITLSFLLLVAGILIYDRRLLVISGEDIPYFIKLGLLGMTLSQFSFYYTISLLSIAMAIFLQYLSPVFNAVYETVWEKQPLSRTQIVFLALAVLGGLLVVIGGGIGEINLTGVCAGLVAAIALSVITVYGRRSVRKYHPVTGTTYVFGITVLFSWLVMPEMPPFASMNSTHLYVIVFITIFSYLIPYLLFFAGVRLLPPTNVGLTACLEPVVAIVAAYFILGEVMSGFQMAGGAFVCSGVIGFGRAKKLLTSVKKLK